MMCPQAWNNVTWVGDNLDISVKRSESIFSVARVVRDDWRAIESNDIDLDSLLGFALEQYI